MRAVQKTVSSILSGIGFLRRQPRDWNVTVARSSSARFFYLLVLPYLSIYTISLGATATQLGIVNTIGMGVAGLLSPLAGWLIDRTGTKTIYLGAIGLLAVAYLTYGVAQAWTIIIVAMIAYQLGFNISGNACGVVCGNSLASEDRATGMAFCETLAAGALGFIAPMFGALLVTNFGGVNTGGIRPLFFIGLVGTIGTFLLIFAKLPDYRWGGLGEAKHGLFKGISQVFQQGHDLKRWLVIASITSGLWMGMALPFTQVFAYEVKGANEYVLGAMVSGMALTTLVFGIPLGKLADRIGRKKVLYLLAPLFWASCLMLIWAPSPGFLIAAGMLQGFTQACMVISAAMSFELALAEQMGRWLGILRFFRMLSAAGAAYLAGAIWDHVGPQYVFIAIIGIDALIRIPLLIGMPETLGLSRRSEQTK
ncbi:MFS transporter [Chloroflexota bacterium]